MTDRRSEEKERSTAGVYRRMRWDAVAAIIAASIGFLALLVAGYTAYIQHFTAKIMVEQTRAQVWPYLQIAWSGNRQSILVLNKGVGPAIVRSVVVGVNGNPQPDWDHVLKALNLSPKTIKFDQSSLNGTVLSPGETLAVLLIPDRLQFRHFRLLASKRMVVRLCFCSTLGDCWRNGLGLDHDYASTGSQSASPCPRVAETDEFHE